MYKDGDKRTVGKGNRKLVYMWCVKDEHCVTSVKVVRILSRYSARDVSVRSIAHDNSNANYGIERACFIGGK